MTLSQLRTLLAVADTGSVRGAAERLVVSQPAVSGAIRALEKELGVTLVARQGRGLRMTAAGLAFAEGARRSLGLLDASVRTARSLETPERGSVRLFSVTTAAEHVLLPLLTEFRRDHPDVEVSLNVGNRTSVWASLRDHETDLVVAGRPPVTVPARVLAVAPNRLVVVASADMARRLHASGDGRLLGSVTWLLREQGSGTREATEALLAELDISPPTMMLGSNGAIEQGVAAGLGIALVSHDAVSQRIAEGSIEVLECPGTPLDRPWHLVDHAREPLSATATRLARELVARGPFVATREGRAMFSERRPRARQLT